VVNGGFVAKSNRKDSIMTTKCTTELLKKPTSDLLEILSVCCKPGSESYREIVKELFRRDVTELGGVVLDMADEHRDRLFREAYDFRSKFDEEWDRLLKSDPIVGEDCRDPCPICHPDRYEEEFGLPVVDAAGKAEKEAR
jgi:hypothetical protein